MGDDNTKTSNLVKSVPNPTGKGGFQERPEDINRDGHWDPNMTFSYQYRKFNNMAVDEFKDWKDKNPQRTMVQELAWTAVFKARTEHKYLTEVANRTEGMPKQAIDMTQSGGIEIKFTEETNGTTDTT